MVYGQLFATATDAELGSLRKLGTRWKVRVFVLRRFKRSRLIAFKYFQQYEKEGKWVYEQHPFWCAGYTYWDLHSEAPDLFLHLSRSDLVIFKGDLNHRKLTYDCAAPASTPFDVSIGPMGSAAGAPVIVSLRTIKSDVVVGLGQDGDQVAEHLDETEPGWKISGKYVRTRDFVAHMTTLIKVALRLLCSYRKVGQAKKFALHRPAAHVAPIHVPVEISMISSFILSHSRCCSITMYKSKHSRLRLQL